MQSTTIPEKSLKQFRSNPPTPIFVQASEYPSFFNRHLVHKSRRIKALLNDPNANIRVFYFQYLMLCYEIQNQNYQYYISKLQNFVLDSSFVFLFLEDDDPTLYNDNQFKHLLLEFMEVLDSAEFETIESALSSFPIADTVFVYFFRSLAIYAQLTNDFDSYIDKTVLFGFLLEQFSIDAQMFEDKCIKFIEAEVFVYEENERTVYLVYKDIESSISDPTNSKMSQLQYPPQVEAEHEQIDVNSMLDSKKEDVEQVHQNISLLEQEDGVEQVHHSRSNSMQNPTQYQRIEKQDRNKKRSRQQDQDADRSAQSNFKKNKIADSEDIYRRITDDMMQKPSVLSCNDDGQPDSNRPSQLEHDGSQIRRSVAEYRLQLKQASEPVCRGLDYSKEGRLFENTYGLYPTHSDNKHMISKIRKQGEDGQTVQQTHYSDYGMQLNAQDYHDKTEYAQKGTYGGTKKEQIESLATTQQYSHEYASKGISQQTSRIGNTMSNRKYNEPERQKNYGDYMFDMMLGRNKTTNSQFNTDFESSSQWAKQTTTINHTDYTKNINSYTYNGIVYGAEADSISRITESKHSKQLAQILPTRDVPTHDVFTPTTTVSGQWPQLSSAQSVHTSSRESLGVAAIKSTNVKSAYLSNQQKFNIGTEVKKNKQPVLTLFDPTLKQITSIGQESNVSHLYNGGQANTSNLPIIKTKTISANIYENGGRDLRQESIKKAEEMKQFIVAKLSVSKEFTDSLTLAKMGEPYNTNIKRMKVRSREIRQSLLNMIK